MLLSPRRVGVVVVGWRGPQCTDQVAGQPAATVRRDPSAGEPELDQVVEDPLGRRSAARRPASSTAPERHSRPASRTWRRWASSRGRTAAAWREPADAGVPGGERLRGGAAGGQAGGDGVVDALARHRVHQPGRVAGQQHRARPRVASARWTAAAGGPSSRSRPRWLRAAARRAARAGAPWSAPVEPPAHQHAVPDVAQPVAAVEGPGVRRLPAPCRRRSPGPRPARAGSGRSHGARPPSAPAAAPAHAGPPSARRRRRRRPAPRAGRRAAVWAAGAPGAPGRAPGRRRRAGGRRPGGGRTRCAGSPRCGAPSAGRRRVARGAAAAAGRPPGRRPPRSRPPRAGGR